MGHLVPGELGGSKTRGAGRRGLGMEEAGRADPPPRQEEDHPHAGAKAKHNRHNDPRTSSRLGSQEHGGRSSVRHVMYWAPASHQRYFLPAALKRAGQQSVISPVRNSACISSLPLKHISWHYLI